MHRMNRQSVQPPISPTPLPVRQQRQLRRSQCGFRPRIVELDPLTDTTVNQTLHSAAPSSPATKSSRAQPLPTATPLGRSSIGSRVSSTSSALSQTRFNAGNIISSTMIASPRKRLPLPDDVFNRPEPVIKSKRPRLSQTTLSSAVFRKSESPGEKKRNISTLKSTRSVTMTTLTESSCDKNNNKKANHKTVNTSRPAERSISRRSSGRAAKTLAKVFSAREPIRRASLALSGPRDSSITGGTRSLRRGSGAKGAGRGSIEGNDLYSGGSRIDSVTRSDQNSGRIKSQAELGSIRRSSGRVGDERRRLGEKSSVGNSGNSGKNSALAVSQGRRISESSREIVVTASSRTRRISSGQEGRVSVEERKEAISRRAVLGRTAKAPPTTEAVRGFEPSTPAEARDCEDDEDDDGEYRPSDEENNMNAAATGNKNVAAAKQARPRGVSSKKTRRRKAAAEDVASFSGKLRVAGRRRVVNCLRVSDMTEIADDLAVYAESNPVEALREIDEVMFQMEAFDITLNERYKGKRLGNYKAFMESNSVVMRILIPVKERISEIARRKMAEDAENSLVDDIVNWIEECAAL